MCPGELGRDQNQLKKKLKKKNKKKNRTPDGILGFAQSQLDSTLNVLSCCMCCGNGDKSEENMEKIETSWNQIKRYLNIDGAEHMPEQIDEGTTEEIINVKTDNPTNLSNIPKKIDEGTIEKIIETDNQNDSAKPNKTSGIGQSY